MQHLGRHHAGKIGVGRGRTGSVRGANRRAIHELRWNRWSKPVHPIARGPFTGPNLGRPQLPQVQAR
jgi:hypothetical protein